MKYTGFYISLNRRAGIEAELAVSFRIGASCKKTFAATMKKRFDKLAAFADNMLGHSFFVGADIGQCESDTARLLRLIEENDRHRQLMVRLLNYALTPDYRKC